MLQFLFFPSFALASVNLQGDPNITYNEYDFNALEKIQVTNTVGKITVLPMAVNKASVKIVKKNFAEACAATISRTDVTMIKVEIKTVQDLNCGADIEVHIPLKVDLDIRNARGDVTIKGMEGKLNYTLGDGALQATGKFAQVEGTSGTGAITINGIAGEGHIKSGTGKVNLTFADEPQGQFSLKSGTGDATLLFTKGTKIKAALDSSSGELNNELGSSDSADFDVEAKTGTGNVQIRSY